MGRCGDNGVGPCRNSLTEIYDEEVLSDQLLLYDWLHLHHEDFTGQYGKFLKLSQYALVHSTKADAEALAKKVRL